MSLEIQRQYLTGKMKAAMSDFDFPIAYPNTKFDIPKNSPYGEFHILSGPQPVPIGGEGKGKVRVRYVGMVQLTVWIPKFGGTKDATLAADAFRELWQFRQFRDPACSTYRFDAARSFDPAAKEGWDCHVHRVPFERDTIEDVQITITE